MTQKVEKQNIRQIIEGHPVVFFLGTLVAGFVAGWTVHIGLQSAAGQVSVSADRLRLLERYETERQSEKVQEQHSQQSIRTQPRRAPNSVETHTRNGATSTNQSGGITANTVNIGSPPRAITGRLEQQLLNTIPPGKKVAIVAVMGDQEAVQFASKIREFLALKGCNVSEVTQAVYAQPVIGQFINPKDGGFEIVIGSRGQ